MTRFSASWAASASPHTLAAFRIAVGVALLLSTELHAATRFASLAPALRIPPEGLGWFVAVVPISEALARGVTAVALFGAVATIIGVYTHVATRLLAAAAFYLLAIGQLSGTVLHDMHLVWFAAILAVSPCGDVWSFDAWWRRRESLAPIVGDPSRVAVAVWTARALFACIYFFPGFWKLATQGLGWALSDNLAYQLHWKSFQWGEVPGFRLDLHPRLLAAGGLGVMAFELGFPFLLATWRTRLVAAGVGLGFHLASEKFFRIPFSSLWVCYPVLIDVARRSWATRVASASTRLREPDRARTLQIFVCAALLIGAVVQGVRAKTDAFPFACYPTFQHHPSREIPDLRIVAISLDASTVDVPHARDARGGRPQIRWGQLWALAGVTVPVDERRLLEYAASVFASNPETFARAERVEMFRARYSVVPEARGAPPTSTVLLASFPIAQVREAALLRRRATP